MRAKGRVASDRQLFLHGLPFWQAQRWGLQTWMYYSKHTLVSLLSCRNMFTYKCFPCTNAFPKSAFKAYPWRCSERFRVSSYRSRTCPLLPSVRGPVYLLSVQKLSSYLQAQAHTLQALRRLSKPEGVEMEAEVSVIVRVLPSFNVQTVPLTIGSASRTSSSPVLFKSFSRSYVSPLE